MARTPKQPRPKGPPTLTELLQTRNPVEQAERVERLIELVQLVPVSIIATYDPRTNKTMVLTTGQVDFNTAHAILASAQQTLREQERQQLLQQAQQPPMPSEGQPPTPPPDQGTPPAPPVEKAGTTPAA